MARLQEAKMVEYILPIMIARASKLLQEERNNTPTSSLKNQKEIKGEVCPYKYKMALKKYIFGKF